jgi:hypothetical protein
MSAYTMGDLGGEVLTGAEAMTAGKVYRGVQVMIAATVTVFTANGVTGQASLLTTWQPGVYLFGKGITGFTITAGLVYLTV